MQQAEAEGPAIEPQQALVKTMLNRAIKFNGSSLTRP